MDACRNARIRDAALVGADELQVADAVCGAGDGLICRVFGADGENGFMAVGVGGRLALHFALAPGNHDAQLARVGGGVVFG